MIRTMITGGLLLCCVPVLHGQSLKGKLFGTHAGVREILPQGFVQWIGQDSLVRVNENGVFELSLTGITDRRLVAGGPYQQTDTIAVGDRTYLSITLREAGAELSGVTVKDQRGAYVSTRTIGQTEVVTRRELTKAACCDLAGCFGTQASVQPQTTNVVTNAQELRILGLSGVYNQVLIDGLPTITGMSYTYGISTYPGTVVDNIFISKGTTSVLQGYEAISGQINLQTSQANNAERLHLNGYINNFGEKHLNVQVASPVGRNKKWHSLLALHTVQPAGKIDRNDDGFMDLPQLTRYMAFNKWQYGNEQQKGLAIQAGLRFVREQRIGGQMNYASPSDEGSTQVYGQSVRYDQAEATLKMAYRFSEKHALVFSTAGLWHDQHSWFGVTKYDARQQTGYLNLQHEWRWHARHVLKYGLSYRYQELKEQVRFSDNSLQRSFAGNYSTPLRVPGVFAENTCNWLNDKWSLITGFRTDRHQQWGWYGTPRAMIRYQSGAHTLRASAGSGWRQVNLFSEQVTLLASSRDIVFQEVLKPELALNWGLNYVYRFSLGKTTGTLSTDFYMTRFRNQFFPDYDVTPGKVVIRNFDGPSRSNGLQVDAAFTFFKLLECRLAYNYLDVSRTIDGRQITLPFNPGNRVMGAVSYRTRNKRWQGDINAHWFDRMRLPDTRSNPEAYQRPLWSSAYMTVNAQATFRWKTLDIYAGIENIAGYRQPNPIIAADNPFSPYFDLSSVWGPTRGRELYLGFRYSIL